MPKGIGYGKAAKGKSAFGKAMNKAKKAKAGKKAAGGNPMAKAVPKGRY